MILFYFCACGIETRTNTRGPRMVDSKPGVARHAFCGTMSVATDPDFRDAVLTRAAVSYANKPHMSGQVQSSITHTYVYTEFWRG